MPCRVHSGFTMKSFKNLGIKKKKKKPCNFQLSRMRVTYTSVSSSDCAKGPLKAYKEVLKKSLAWEGDPTGPGALSWHTPWGSSPHSPFCSNCICQLLSGKDSRIMISGKWELLLFSLCVVSDGLRPHSLQCTRLPCPSPSPRVSSNSHPLSW